ncbi:MAG: hypothetical protein SGJ20_00270, partial [Planctomycetota bacterium]|nr:hypothetical protein [Planctomycetota bacterium]
RILGNWGEDVTLGDLLVGDLSSDGFVGQDDLNLLLAGWGTRVVFPDDPIVVWEDSELMSIEGELLGYTYGELPTPQVTTDRPDLFSVQPRIEFAVESNIPYLSFQPAPDTFGEATVTILQPFGQAPQTFTITIEPVDDLPTFTPGGDIVWSPRKGEYSEIWATNISSGPENEGEQELFFDVDIESGAELFETGPTIAPDGRLTFTPKPGALGTAEIDVMLYQQVSDNYGNLIARTPTKFSITLTDTGPQITAIEHSPGQPLSNAALTAPLSSIVITFDRVMTENGAGGVQEKSHWVLLKDGNPIADQIDKIEVVSAPGEPTQLRFTFASALSTGVYQLATAAEIIDLQGFELETAADFAGGINLPIGFTIAIDTGLPVTAVIDLEDPETEINPNPETAQLDTPVLPLSIDVQPNALNRIQGGGGAVIKKQEPVMPGFSLQTPADGSHVSHLVSTGIQPDVAVTGTGTILFADTLPEVTVDDEGDEFLSREEARKGVPSVSSPSVSRSDGITARFPWWWVAIGGSSILGGIGYYTIQRKIALRKVISSPTEPELVTGSIEIE